jgi:hypothetical protein
MDVRAGMMNMSSTGILPRRMVPQVQPGNRFAKTGNSPGKVWEVVDLAVAVDGIMHARLRSCDGRGDRITIGAGVLLDQVFWLPMRPEA